MAIRTPRFKSEFLSLQNISFNERVNILLTTNQFSVIEKALINHLSDPTTNNKYTFGLLSFNNFFYNSDEWPLLAFSHETSRKAEDNIVYERRAFELKYLTQEFQVKREEDLGFLSKLIASGIAFNPQFQSLADRSNNRKNGILSPRVITEILRAYSNEIEDTRELTNQDRTRLRQLSTMILGTPLDSDFNIYVGCDYIIQSDLAKFSPEYLYHFLYLYLYRLYDLTINRGLTLNICVILEGISDILRPEVFDSFYVSKEEALERHRKIILLLRTLLENGTRYKLNFMILDSTPEMIEFASPYCKLIDQEISNVTFDFKNSINS